MLIHNKIKEIKTTTDVQGRKFEKKKYLFEIKNKN